ncbi:Cys-tRNA(Pro) deacylase [Alkalilimnicola sp. S0819]|uniref:Cys-tRNA(Pro) deacylase n=1 Tax=Alkalilimnicola sp. S0819 TaxID=2613922 RepID=UPI00126292CD|nr:Cys-tRNA(Pro) deacylase [Alkalilimnicola sp. S0819]KAB7628168.1 Cys-tRNA(Pro) deacylase [Alkalilimnicola sp. S0819]MPQ15055.1 Cys-tRNA(Pro) deacylase [Alkalilimnicola sp. S0819]
MTPAVSALKRAGISFELLSYTHDPAAVSYGLEAAEALGLAPEQVFKTLVAQLDDGRLAVGIVPVTASLDLKALAAALGARKAVMAELLQAERATGYVVGGISPLGQRKRLSMVLDRSADAWPVIYVSGGRRGLELALAPTDLQRLSGARIGAIARAAK